MEFEINIGNLFFMSELLLAELIFLYAAPKKLHFWTNLLGGMVLSVGVSALIPYIGTMQNQLLWNLMRFTILFSVSVLLMYHCFDLKISQVFSMCVAGYAVQHVAYRMMRLILGTTFTVLANTDPVLLRFYEVGIVLFVYLLFLLGPGRFCAQHECFKYQDMRFNYLACITVFICIGTNRLARIFGEDPNSMMSNIYAALSCGLALYIQFNFHKQIIDQQEKQMLRRIQQEEEKRFENSQNAMEALNIRVHDLKHLLVGKELQLPQTEIEKLERDIQNYDDCGKTGSPTLDVLLSEKWLMCQKRNIRLDCSGDFSVLDFIATMDLYSLFGNAIDNAIEAVEKVTVPGKKTIEISVESRGDLVFASFTNYYDGELFLTRGVPQTTKPENPEQHGFGIKSMRRIAAKYGGEISVTANGALFNLVFYAMRQNPPEELVELPKTKQ